MADFKDNMYRRLRSARQWLKRAEEAFDKDRDVRAELDLMLAQAELQHAKEANRTRHWRYKYSMLTQGAAIGFAAMIAVIGFGGTYWWSHQHQTSNYQSSSPAVQLQAPQQPIAVGNNHIVTTNTQEIPAANTKPDSASATVKTAYQEISIVPKNREKEDRQSYQTEVKEVLPPDEMQKLVRAAGKSLRGQ